MRRALVAGGAMGLLAGAAIAAHAGSPVGEALEAAAAGKRFFAAGGVDLGGNTDWRVEAYDKTGAVLWTDDFGGVGTAERARDLAVKGKTLVATGLREDPPLGDDWLVRALHAKTGTLLWDLDEADAGAPTGVAVKGKRVFVSGRRNHGVDSDFYVAAYDLRTGALLWDDAYDPHADDDVATDVAVRGKRVVVVGFVRNGANTDFYVRALDARDGSFLWDDRLDPDGSSDQAVAVAAKGRRAYVVGAVTRGDRQFFVRAYDVKTGDELWSDTYDHAGGLDGATRVAAKGKRVFAAGQVNNGADADALLRAYDGKTGQFLWDDLHDAGAATDGSRGLAVRGSRVYHSGFQTVGGNVDAFVRALRAKSGELLGDDVTISPAAELGNGVAAKGKQVFQALEVDDQFDVRFATPE